MPEKHGDQMSCMLCRAGRQGVTTLAKARKRKIEWPVATETQLSFDQADQIHTTIDEAFSTILQYMSVTSRQCRLQKSEDVHVELAPGTYAVTAGQWGAPRGHTQVVRLDPGQTVDMTFTCR